MAFSQHLAHGSIISNTGSGWRLEIPSGPSAQYRLAQLDDYSSLRRKQFTYQTPATLSLRARASSNSLPGTWGFGLWNDPFSTIIGLGGITRPLPALPNAAWFFFASPENHLSFRTDKTPNGFLAATFHSPLIPSLLLTPLLALFPMLYFQVTAKWVRQKMSRVILEDNALLDVDATDWHDYKMQWEMNKVLFEIDGKKMFETSVSPAGPLGFVIWIDNQFASFAPSGRISAGFLESPVGAWIEIQDILLR